MAITYKLEIWLDHQDGDGCVVPQFGISDHPIKEFKVGERICLTHSMNAKRNGYFVVLSVETLMNQQGGIITTRLLVQAES